LEVVLRAGLSISVALFSCFLILAFPGPWRIRWPPPDPTLKACSNGFPLRLSMDYRNRTAFFVRLYC